MSGPRFPVLPVVALACLLAFLPGASALADASKAVARTPAALHVLNWSEYIDLDENPDKEQPLSHRSPTLRKFMKQYGCEIVYDDYDTETNMLKKLQNMPGFYDVVVTTSSMIDDLSQAGLLAPLTKAAIPNLKLLAPKYQNMVQGPAHGYFAPYLAGSTGLAYRVDLVGKTVTSWLDYFHPAQDLKGGLATLDSSFMLYIGMLAQGCDPSSRNIEDIRAAARLFLDLRRDGFLGLISSNMEETTRKLANGDLAMAIMYSGDALSAMQENPNIRYVIPKEGGEFYVDGMAIPIDSANKRLAERFINFILSPEINGRLAAALNFASPVVGSSEIIRKIDPSDLNNPAIVIPPETMDRLWVFSNRDAEEVRRMWRKIVNY